MKTFPFKILTLLALTLLSCSTHSPKPEQQPLAEQQEAPPSPDEVLEAPRGPEPPREPAGDYIARSESEQSYINPMADPTTYYQRKEVTSTRNSREQQRRAYYQQPDAMFPGYFNRPAPQIGLPYDPYNRKFGPVTEQNKNDCGGVAYYRLRTTIANCGCEILDACARTQGHRDAGPSCHRIGAAIDVMSVKCDGYNFPVKARYGRTRYPDWANWGRKRYWQFVACQSRYFEHTIWQQYQHYDHAHFAYECRVNGHRKW